MRAYQVRGFSWIDFLTQLGLGACLADDMGLGKTIQTLAFLQRERENCERRPVLLVCPTSVVNNWQKEAARFTPELPVMIHHGSTRKRGAVFQSEAAAHALVLSSYALLQRDQFAVFAAVRAAADDDFVRVHARRAQPRRKRVPRRVAGRQHSSDMRPVPLGGREHFHDALQSTRTRRRQDVQDPAEGRTRRVMDHRGKIQP